MWRGRLFALKPDWLDVAQFPAMTYAGRIVFVGDEPASVDGKLTLRGVTRRLRLTIDRFGCVTHPAGTLTLRIQVALRDE